MEFMAELLFGNDLYTRPAYNTALPGVRSPNLVPLSHHIKQYGQMNHISSSTTRLHLKKAKVRHQPIMAIACS